MSTHPDPANLRVDACLGLPRPDLEAAIRGPDDLVELRRRWEQAEAIPVLVPERTEGRDDSWAGLDIRTLLRGEQSAGRFATHSVVVPPGAGLPLHYQQDAYAYVLVIEGVLDIQVGKVHEQLEEFGFAFVPPRTRFAFGNTSGAPCTLMLVYSPAGAERAFKDAHARWLATKDVGVSSYQPMLERYGFRFDAQVLENDEKTNQPISRVDGEIKRPGDMAKLRAAFAQRPALPRVVKTAQADIDAKVRIGEVFRKAAVTGDDSAGHGMFHLLVGKPGQSAPPHHQPTEEEFFFIARGEMEVVCGNKTVMATGGAFSFNPRNCTHGFRFSLTQPTCIATLNSPAGHERGLAALREASAAGASPGQLRDLTIAGEWILHEDLTSSV